jgi:hypothetical protein
MVEVVMLVGGGVGTAGWSARATTKYLPTIFLHCPQRFIQ